MKKMAEVLIMKRIPEPECLDSSPHLINCATGDLLDRSVTLSCLSFCICKTMAMTVPALQDVVKAVSIPLKCLEPCPAQMKCSIKGFYAHLLLLLMSTCSRRGH